MRFLITAVFIIFSFLFKINAQAIIPPEQAFSVSFEKKDDFLFFNIDMPEDVYLLDEHIKFTTTKPIKTDFTSNIQKSIAQDFKGNKVYFENFRMSIPIDYLREKNIKGKANIVLHYQGCAGGGVVCYPPMSKTVVVNIKEGFKNNYYAENDTSEQGKIANFFTNKSFIFIFISFFGFGVLLSLTPCILPMIPILSSIIVQYSSKNMNAKKGFLISLVYVLSTSITYAIAGIIAGKFGENIQASLQNTWVIATFSILFVLLAFSMFGFYKIQLPVSLQTKLSKSIDGKKGIFGVVIMGVLSALVVGPCVAAPLAGALIYIGHSGDAFLGGVALFMMSFGMGIPLLLIGTSAGKFLPKPGIWMNRILNIFGIIMLGLAIWILSRIIPENITLMLYGMLITGVSLLLIIKNFTKQKSILILIFIFFMYGLSLLVGGISGSNSFANPFANFISKTEKKGDLKFLHVENISELDKIIEKNSGFIMVDFTAKWCITCKEFDEFTLTKAGVQEKLKDFTLVKIDVTKNSQEDKELMRKFAVFGPPAFVFYDKQNELKNLQIVGFKSESEFLIHLDKVLNNEN